MKNSSNTIILDGQDFYKKSNYSKESLIKAEKELEILFSDTEYENLKKEFKK